jgi:membrane protein implicated in regulation of membrane protease activity
MRRISTLLEVLLSAALFIFGLYLVHAAISVNSAYGALVLLVGAVSCSLGQMFLVFAVKSILFHRRMLRRSVHNQNADRSKREYSLH